MVKDAEAAGFNPLTALRNGGSAGFSVTSQPVLSSRHAAIGDAISGIGNFLANFDPMADDKREQEYQLVQAQIRNLNASSDAMRRPQSFNVPTYTASKVERRPSGTAAQLSHKGAALAPVQQVPDLTNPTPAGNSIWEVDPDQPDASAWEDRYGEPGAWFGGAWNAVIDANHNLQRFGRNVIGPKLGERFNAWRRRAAREPRVNQDKRPRLRRVVQ